MYNTLNIAAQCALLYGGAPSKVTDSPDAEFFMPLSFRAFIKVANNSVGAAQQINFLVEGSGANEKISYNGHKINFHPLGATFMIFTIPTYLKVLTDATSDLNSLQIDKVANGAMQRYIKNTQSMATWVTNQRYITLYGG